MKILAQVTFKKFGNDCLIEKTLTVVEIFDQYFTYSHTRYHGSWCDDEIREEKHSWNSREEALEAYRITLKENEQYACLA